MDAIAALEEVGRTLQTMAEAMRLGPDDLISDQLEYERLLGQLQGIDYSRRVVGQAVERLRAAGGDRSPAAAPEAPEHGRDI